MVKVKVRVRPNNKSVARSHQRLRKRVNIFAEKCSSQLCVSLHNNKLHWAGSPIAIKKLGENSHIFEQALGEALKATIILKVLMMPLFRKVM